MTDGPFLSSFRSISQVFPAEHECWTYPRLITVYTENSSLWSRVLVYTVNSRGVHGPLVPLLFTVGTGTMRCTKRKSLVFLHLLVA